MHLFNAVINRRHGGYFYVIDEQMQEIPCRLKGILKKNTDIRNLAVVGDQVLVSLVNDHEGLIHEILKRHNFIRRAKGFQRKYAQREEKTGQILAANIDQVIIFLSAKEPDFHPLLLDRFLVFVEAMELKPVVFINKCELLLNSRLDNLINDYQKYYQILPISIHQSINIERVKELVNKRISFIVGPSGAGKSSLLNHLNPQLQIPTGIWTNRCKTGPQTTSSTTLHPLWKKTFLADSAGFSQVFLFHISRFVLREYYPEFRNLLPCTYSNCLHNDDEGCLIEQQAKQGNISFARLERYRALLKECNDIFPEYAL